MSNPNSHDDDMPRDERLRAALRHAPDREQTPPARLAASIRAAARAELRPEPRQDRWAGLRQLWHTLGAPRPVWAGGAAALLVSVLTLQLWHDEPVPTAAPSPAAAPAPSPAPSPATAPSTAPAAATPTAPTLSDLDASRKAEPMAPARSQRPADPTRQRAQQPPGTVAESVASAKPTTRATQPAPAPLAAPATPMAAPAAATSMAPPAAVPTQAAAHAQREVARAEATVTAPEPKAATGPDLPAPPRSLDAAGGAPARERAAQGKVAAAPALAAAAGATRNTMRDDAAGAAAVAGTRPPTLAVWLRALASGGTADLPSARLLQLLDAAAGARWQALPPPAAAAMQEGERSSERSWPGPQGGQVTLRLQAGGARWIEPDGRHWFVALDDAALLALRQAL